MSQLLAAIEQFFPKESTTTISKDILEILRDVHYVIADKALFGSVPRDENDVHIRIEGILKCVFPDLKHTPALSKPIKNFEPDTGVPSIKTLIEYKFLSSSEDVAPLADELLADTRGYVSEDWKNFIIVIYETNRFRPEKERNHLLIRSDVSESTTVVVLGGEPARKRRTRRRSPAALKRTASRT